MNTPLQTAAQALIDAIKRDRHDPEDWPEASKSALDNLRRALEAEQAQAVEPAQRHLPENVARLLIERYLKDDHGYDEGGYTIEKQGDSAHESHIWAFWIFESDSTSYLHEDGKIEWCGTSWEPVEQAQQVAVPYDQQALELCPECGWKAIMPGEPCFVCNMQAAALSDFDMRGVLASNLMCWHRLTEAEAQDLICFFEKVRTAEAKQAHPVDAMKATPEDMLIYRNIAKQAQQVAVPDALTGDQIIEWMRQRGLEQLDAENKTLCLKLIRAYEENPKTGAKP